MKRKKKVKVSEKKEKYSCADATKDNVVKKHGVCVVASENDVEALRKFVREK